MTGQLHDDAGRLLAAVSLQCERGGLVQSSALRGSRLGIQRIGDERMDEAPGTADRADLDDEPAAHRGIERPNNDGVGNGQHGDQRVLVELRPQH